MTKFLMTALLAASFSFSVNQAKADQAADDSYDPRTSVVNNLEDGPMNSVELATQSASPSVHEFSLKLGNIGDILKRIAGDVIRAEILDKQYGRDGYRRQVTCYAVNRRGEYFRASGNRPRQVQARAIDKCYAYSRDCRPAGCQ